MLPMAMDKRKLKVRVVTTLIAVAFLLGHAGLVAANGAKIIIGPSPT